MNCPFGNTHHLTAFSGAPHFLSTSLAGSTDHEHNNAWTIGRINLSASNIAGGTDERRIVVELFVLLLHKLILEFTEGSLFEILVPFGVRFDGLEAHLVHCHHVVLQQFFHFFFDLLHFRLVLCWFALAVELPPVFGPQLSQEQRTEIYSRVLKCCVSYLNTVFLTCQTKILQHDSERRCG